VTLPDVDLGLPMDEEGPQRHDKATVLSSGRQRYQEKHIKRVEFWTEQIKIMEESLLGISTECQCNEPRPVRLNVIRLAGKIVFDGLYINFKLMFRRV
jgi:hypothetical protein